MKKIIALTLALIIATCVFTACSKNEKTNQNTQETQATVEHPTDDAQIKMNDAITLIQSYTNEELGLTQEERDTCTFAVAGSGKEVNGELFIEVIAAIKNENEDGTFTFDTRGTYYISYDAAKVLVKNGDSYTNLPIRS